MADAQRIIAQLGQQVAQLTVDKAILEVELGETRERLAALEASSAPAVQDPADADKRR